MTNSNDRNNLATDQTDDLIAELARIVADDAKQSSVSQSVDERTQLAVDAREQQSNVQSFEPPREVETPAFSNDQPKVAPVEEGLPSFAQTEAPAPFSQIGEGVTPIHAELQPASLAPVAEESGLSLDDGAPASASPFEFDFSQNIQDGVEELSSAPSEPEPDFAAQFAEVEPLASIDEEEVPSPDALDSIAAIIEDVELQSAEPEVPAFDPIPVPNATASQAETLGAALQVEPGQPANSEFEYIPQQGMHVPNGEDEFAVPPAHTSDGADLTAVVDDPLAEIESLIADTTTPDTRPAQQPADAAEAAILAALASAAGNKPNIEHSPVAAARASTAQTKEPRLEPAAPTARDYVQPVPSQVEHAQAARPEPEIGQTEDRRRGSILPIAASVAAIVLLAVVGGIGYWIFAGQSPTGQDVPVVSAQNTNVKETPVVTASETDGASVFDALQGNAETTIEQLVSRDETDGASSADVARVVTPNSSNSGLTNRKVKTVTVLADGTIVSGTEASAGAEQLPQDVRPNAPTVAIETDTAATDEIASVLNSIKEGTEIVTQPVATTTPVESVVDETAALVVAAIADDPTAPQPPARPFGLGSGAAPSLAAIAVQPTTTTAQPISLLPTASAPSTNTSSATSTGVSAPFYVQLASQRSVEAAQNTATSLTRQFASDLSNRTIDINQVNLGDKGIYFRVRVPSNSLADANALCSSLKANGGDCFVRNN